MRSSLVFCILFFVLFQWGFAQQPAGQQEPTVIDLTKLGKTYTISARMELPQVRMFDKRLTPDFKQLSAEKSFANELSPQAEEIRYEPITSGKVKPVDNVESLLKKKRF